MCKIVKTFFKFLIKSLKLILISFIGFIICVVILFSFINLEESEDSVIKETLAMFYEESIRIIGDAFVVDYINSEPVLMEMMAQNIRDNYFEVQADNTIKKSDINFRYIKDAVNSYLPNYEILMDSVKPKKINFRMDGSDKEIKTSEIYQRNKSSIVIICLEGEGIDNYGSGFVVSSNGIIATNYHVISVEDEVEDNEDIRRSVKIGVAFPENKKVYPVESILAIDEVKDLAIVKIADENNFPSVVFPDKNKLEIGNEIISIGSPLNLPNTLLNGLLSSVYIDERNMEVYQISIPIAQGNSGGPVIDLSGHVVGIVSAKSGYNPYLQNFNYAIPIDYLIDMMDEVNKK
jgi:S1-C subfamily serine protease